MSMLRPTHHAPTKEPEGTPIQAKLQVEVASAEPRKTGRMQNARSKEGGVGSMACASCDSGTCPCGTRGRAGPVLRYRRRKKLCRGCSHETRVYRVQLTPEQVKHARKTSFDFSLPRYPALHRHSLDHSPSSSPRYLGHSRGQGAASRDQRHSLRRGVDLKHTSSASPEILSAYRSNPIPS